MRKTLFAFCAACCITSPDALVDGWRLVRNDYMAGHLGCGD
jgi:hypothetical protein